jgi:hypothetical protein
MSHKHGAFELNDIQAVENANDHCKGEDQQSSLKQDPYYVNYLCRPFLLRSH